MIVSTGSSTRWLSRPRQAVGSVRELGRVRRPNGRDRRRNGRVRRRPHVQHDLVLLAEHRQHAGARLSAQVHCDGPFHHRADSLADVPGRLGLHAPGRRQDLQHVGARHVGDRPGADARGVGVEGSVELWCRCVFSVAPRGNSRAGDVRDVPTKTRSRSKSTLGPFTSSRERGPRRARRPRSRRRARRGRVTTRCRHSSSPVSSVVGDDDVRLGVPHHGRQLRSENAFADGSWRSQRRADGASAPRGDLRPQRIVPVPSQYSESARLDVERSILPASGFPVSLLIPPAELMLGRAGGGSFMVTLAPAAVLVGAELQRVGGRVVSGAGCRNGGRSVLA